MASASGSRSDPPLFRKHVRRPRLTSLLDDLRAQAIVLVAPAGYGKTVLAAEWTQGKPNVVWYRATRASADLATFALAIAAAVEPLAPGTSERLRKRVGSTLGEEGPRVLAELLAPAVEDWPADGLLVLDDFHHVQQSHAAEELTDWLLTLTPIRLLVTTRARPAWASARRVLYGEVAEVGREELALTAAEAHAVLTRLPAEVARNAIARAQGWPALVGLAALSAPPETPSTAVSDGLYRYFADEVLKSEPPDVQRFMSVAAVPLTVDAATARALGVEEPERALDHLASEGLLEPAGHAYRFHPLLRDFLRTRLEPERLLMFTDLATKHALAAGNVEEAFELAVEGDRLERAAEIAAGAARDLLTDGRTETLERWLDACGPAALLHPMLVIARASILLRRGNPSDAASLAHDVANRLGDDDPKASRAWYVSAQAHHMLCRWTDALGDARKAVRLAATEQDRTNALLLAVLAGSALEVDVSHELEALESIAAGDLHARFRLASAQMRVGFTRPSAAGTWERVAALIPLIDHCDGPMLQSDVLAGAAYLNMLRAEYDTAVALAEQAAAVSAEAKLRLPHAFSSIYIAAADIGRRRFGRAERALGAVREVASLERRGLRIVLESVRIKLALARGEDPAPAPLEDLVVDGTSPRQQAVYAALAALAEAKRGNADAARGLATWARMTSSSGEAAHVARFAELFADDVLDAAMAVELVQSAVAADLPDTFVVAYRAFPELLDVVALDARCATLVRPLVRRAGDDRLAQNAGLLAPAEQHAAHEALTPRESEVLALMAEGLSNAEIAQRLFISPSTTKVHVHHILEKLGSKSRFEAVLKSGLETPGDGGKGAE